MKGTSPAMTSEARGNSRADVYVDDETLQRMIASFGPVEYSQIAAASAFNSLGSYTLGEMIDTQNPISWKPETSFDAEEQRRKSRSPRPGAVPALDPRHLLREELYAEDEKASAAEPKRESLMEWFDRSVDKELQKRRDIGSPSTFPVDPALASIKNKPVVSLSKGTAERLAEASASRIEISARLETDFTTDLTEAVEKFAKAEAMSNYAAALQAAEEAAVNAPPELIEQAAAAGARRIITEMSQINETIDGIKPIEVIGYVGVTKPVHAKKS